MAELFSRETQELLEAADWTIARSRELAVQRREMMARCKEELRAQEKRFALRRAIWKPK
jgi:hypothetical protein